jgi:DNA-nicking Smr family endonuclease
MRRLTPEERALWARLATTVRPIAVDAAKASVTPAKAGASVGKNATAVSPTTETPFFAGATCALAGAKVSPSRRPSPSANTLDAKWDKSLRMGSLAPDMTIDLHGETLATAHTRLNRSLAAAVRDGARLILLITGRAPRDNPRLPPTSRGVIRASVADWLAASPHADRIAAIRNAHPRHGGGGALYLVMRRAR